MTLNDILTLGKMGFTKEEIMKLKTPTQQTQQPQQPQQTQQTPQTDFLDEIKKLRQEIARGSSFNTQSEETVDDILATILNPKEVK